MARNSASIESMNILEVLVLLSCFPQFFKALDQLGVQFPHFSATLDWVCVSKKTVILYNIFFKSQPNECSFPCNRFRFSEVIIHITFSPFFAPSRMTGFKYGLPVPDHLDYKFCSTFKIPQVALSSPGIPVFTLSLYLRQHLYHL